MAEKIKILGNQAERINDSGRSFEKISATEFAAKLGAEPISEQISNELDPIALAEIGTQLLKRLRSSGGRPALVDASQVCKVPLSSEDISTLEQINQSIEKVTGAKPSLGQTASVILRMQLQVINAVSQEHLQNTSKESLHGQRKNNQNNSPTLSSQAEIELETRVLQDCKKFIQEQLAPIHKQLNHLAEELRHIIELNRNKSN